jgi:hypothetical protein
MQAHPGGQFRLRSRSHRRLAASTHKLSRRCSALRGSTIIRLGCLWTGSHPADEGERPVRPNRIRKSASAENTFSSDLRELDPMVSELEPLIDKVWRHCESTGSRGRAVTLKVTFADFQIITRSGSVRPSPTARISPVRRSACSRTPCRSPRQCACWASRCHRCRERTIQSRNWIS